MAPKRKRGTQRIDAAIDHFFPMGYTARQVRTAVNALLKVYYMDPNAWRVLEEDSYCVVQERLLEMEEEEKKLLEQEMLEEEEPEPEQEHPQQQEPALDEVPLLQQETQEEEQEPEHEQPQQLGPEPDEVPLLEQEREPEQEQPQQQEPAVDEVPPQSNSLMLEWHNVKPAGLESSEATRTGRRPCYGWLSESEDEEEQTVSNISGSRLNS